MSKKVLSLIICALLAFGSAATALAADTTEEKPEYIKIAQQNNIKSYYDDSGNQIDITKLNNDINVDDSILPESYDLRSFGRVTSVKNQGTQGLCWDFAATASIESNILSQPELASKAGENPQLILDLSEAGNTWYFHTNIDDEESVLYDDYKKDPSKGANGGFTQYVADSLAAGYGAYPESLMPYDEWDNGYSEALRYYSDFRLKDYNELTYDEDIIKKSVMENGAVTVTYNCFNSNTYVVDGMEAYYDDGTPIEGQFEQSHVVAIVGWDDSFSKDNFNPRMQPENDGSWLCKNSWGENSGSTSEGYEGYFWMSYETNTLGISGFCMQSVEEFDNIYQHQITYDYSLDVSSAANVFTTNSNETLKQICFAAVGASDVSVEIYRLNDDFSTPVDGTLLSSFDVFTDFTGVHCIECPEEIKLNKGDLFSVVINQKSQLQLNFKSDSGKDFSNLSYYMTDNGEWKDVADDFNYSYAAIKAYTLNSDGTDKSNLENAIKNAEAVNPDEYIDDELITELNNQLEYSRTVLSDKSATQNCVDNAVCLLNKSISKITNYTFTVNSSEDYYTLYNKIENNKDSNIKRIVLGADIDFGGNTISPIYTYTDFSGVFDGNGHTMSNFMIYGNMYGQCGIFGRINNAAIQNVTFSDCVINSENSASIISNISTDSTIENCHVINSKIKSDIQSAALCASTYNTAVNNCSVKGTEIYGNFGAGAFVIGSFESSPLNCTLSDTKLCSASIVTNGNMTVTTYSQDSEYLFSPIITLDENGCTIESFIGTITDAKSEEATVTKEEDLYKIDAKSGDVYVELSYENADNIDYTVSGDIETRELFLNGYIGNDNDMVIPSELFGNPIVGFSQYFSDSFQNRDNITSLSIPGTIETVPYEIFSEMPSLKVLKINEGVKTIEYSAFERCYELSKISLPDSLTSIMTYAFNDCISLSEIEFGNNLEYIGDNCFEDCISLVDPVLPNSLKEIGSNAFLHCGFKSVTLGKNIEIIGENAFACTGQSELDFNIVYIPDFVINGYKSTAAETYVNGSGLMFVDIATHEPVTTGELFDYSVFIKGDVNLDGVVNVLDATLINKWLADEIELDAVSRCNTIVCDAYSEITVQNATDIQKYSAGLIDSLDSSAAG